MNLRDLPVKFALEDDKDVGRIYVEELKQVATAAALKDFVKRWVALYYLDEIPGDKNNEVLQSLKDGTFDAEEALQCITANRLDICKHNAQEHSCAGMHIAIPSIMIKAFLAAQHYGVPINVALVQLCGGEESGYWD